VNAVLKEIDYRIAYDGCPLCSGEGSEFRSEYCFPKSGISCELTWMKCGSCSHVYTSHYFDESGYKQLLSTVMQDGCFGGKIDEQREIWGAIIQRLIPHAGKGRWIDVGVGNGGFLFTADEFGFDAVGIDKRAYILQDLKALGYKVEEADATTFDYSGATVVILADILEHIPYPKELLRHIRKDLRGAIYISCPNMDSVSWRYMDTVGGTPYWKESEHYHNFTRARLQALLKECGFTPVYFGVSPRYQAGMEIIAI